MRRKTREPTAYCTSCFAVASWKHAGNIRIGRLSCRPLNIVLRPADLLGQFQIARLNVIKCMLIRALAAPRWAHRAIGNSSTSRSPHHIRPQVRCDACILSCCHSHTDT